METNITLNAASSVIVAEGKRRSPFGIWLWVLLGALAGGALLLLGLWLGLSRTVQIPDTPALQVSIVPFWFHQLPESTKQRLPQELRHVLDHKGRWPVVVGLFRENEAWRWYAVAPVWTNSGRALLSDRAGLVKTIGSSGGSSRPFEYGEHLAWHGIWPKPLAFRLEGVLLAELAGLDPSIGWPVVKGRMDNGLLRTDLKALGTESELPPLKDADVSLNVAPLLADGTGGQKLSEWLTTQHKNLDLPVLAQWNAWLGSSKETSQTLFVFNEDLNAAQAGALLGAHGFSARRVVELPDETLGVERVAPYATDTKDLLGIRTNPQGEEVELGIRSLRVSRAQANEPIFDAIPACGRSFRRPMALFSKNAVETIAERLGLPLTLPQGGRLFVGFLGESLTLCISP